jgi:hypothetical protein
MLHVADNELIFQVFFPMFKRFLKKKPGKLALPAVSLARPRLAKFLLAACSLLCTIVSNENTYKYIVMGNCRSSFTYTRQPFLCVMSCRTVLCLCGVRAIAVELSMVEGDTRRDTVFIRALITMSRSSCTNHDVLALC